MQETLNIKKKGDNAFQQKDFRAAIESYTQVYFSLFADYRHIQNFYHALGRFPSITAKSEKKGEGKSKHISVVQFDKIAYKNSYLHLLLKFLWNIWFVQSLCAVY